MMTTELKFDCVFCKEIFDDKEALQVHFRKHGDPNFNTSIKNIVSEKTTDENETVCCDVCDEVFPTISKAITHKHKAHPDHDAKYFCPFCGKLFTMKHLYNKHIQSNHGNEEISYTKDFHCDCCEVDFYLPSALMCHNKFFHRQDTELPAVGQSKKVKTYNQEMLQIYYCSFCGEEYNNKVNLHKHMGDDHGDENQSPTEVLRCPLCEAIFYHLDAYEVHLMFHSTEDLYSVKNELAATVTEFSLETVAPITERVEEEQQDNDMNGIDNFLQLVMNESTDNAPEKVKSKKHKKHKKSKKAAITLDEFLNMNKDVFGDGLDVEGIEEVPTQVVLKKAKAKRLPVKGQSKIVNADLAKLQQQGITVKTKSGARPVGNIKNNMECIQVNKANTSNSPDEILSKFLNESNSQIKIVKKSISPSDPQNMISDTSKSNNEDTDLNDNKEDIEKETEDEPISENSKSNRITDKASNIQENNESNGSNNVSNTDDECLNSEKSESRIALPESQLLSSSEINEKNSHICAPSSIVPGQTVDDTESDLLADYQVTDKNEKSCGDDANAEGQTEYSESDTDSNIGSKTLDALKHLSHLITVKPLNIPKSPNVSYDEINSENESKVNKDLHTKPPSQDILDNEQKTSSIKTMSNQVSMKSLKPLPPERPQSDIDSEDDINNQEDSDLSAELEDLDEMDNLDNNIKRVKLKIKNIPFDQSKQLHKNDKVLNREAEEEDESRNYERSGKGASSANIDILKRLTNVTAKAIPSVKNIKPANIKIAKPNVTQVKEPPQKLNNSPVEVEIFNIDDSDSEEDHKLEDKQSDQPLDALRTLGKNITIKSNQHNVPEVKDKKFINKNIRADLGGESHIKLSKHSPDIQKSINLQNKLKSLGGNITVKSRNSPNFLNRDEHMNFEEFDDNEEHDSEPEPNIGKVKITEVTEDDISDSECPDSRTDAIVESPHASNSENEDNHNETDEEFADLENEIKKTILKKQEEPTTSNKPSCLENLKHLGKNLTIRSLNAKKNDSDDESNEPTQKEVCENTNNFSKQTAIKHLKINPSQNNQTVSKSSQSNTSVNQTLKKNVSTSSNQVNTVKTVKKYQSQTVIEEITTTVTKTIRTVNQSSNEIVQNNTRSGPRPMIRPQKILNRPQGPVTRHVAPTVGTRIRNATPIRHAAPSTVKPSNQIVPVRSALNIQRNPGSNTAVRKIAPPKSSQHKPVVGTLKISPHALNQTVKRSSEETQGHFSCFKKLKESPMGSSDMADGFDDTVQYAAATHTQSNFSSVTKTVKGKGTVTATQTRSEVSTSQQQLSKLGNMSGIKIAKMSSKQSMQVEEKNVINTANKSTLSALEKLQKQGLLVKKPRIEEYNERSQSESDEDPS